MAKSRIRKQPSVSRQYEISQNHIDVNSSDSDITQVFTPGGLPDMPAEGLAPDNRRHINRGKEISKNDTKDTGNFYLGLESIDEAIFYYFENIIKPSVLSNGDLIDVPLIYGSGERWKLAQKDGFYRDKGGKIQTPLVMIKRESIEKRRDLGNKLDANNPQLFVTYQEKYTNRNQYDNFSILNNRVPQKEYTYTVVPDYVHLTYQGIIWTDYISQLNKIIEAINYASDSYWGDQERFKFMTQIDQFNNIQEISSDDSRIVRANFSLKLQGYIIPDNIQRKLKDHVKWYGTSQLVVNNGVSNRLQQLSTQKATSNLTITGDNGGGGITQVTSEGTDQDWIIFDEYLKNYGNKDVLVSGGNFIVDIGATKTSDILIVKKNGNTQLKVDNDGILSFKEFTSFPTAVDGGIIFKDNNFYLGL